MWISFSIIAVPKNINALSPRYFENYPAPQNEVLMKVTVAQLVNTLSPLSNWATLWLV